MILEDLAIHIQGKGIATIGSDLFLEQMPDVPDNLAVLYSYAGRQGYMRAAASPLMERPRCQVVVRDASIQAAHTKAEQLYNALHGRHLILSGTVYRSIEALQQPFKLKVDEKGRDYVIFNLEAIKEA